MARPTRKAPIVSGDGPDRILSLDHDDWLRIERACGWTLASGTRIEIVHATEMFLAFESLERNNQSLAAVKITLESYDAAVGRFFRALFADTSGTSDAEVCAQHLIEQNFRPVGQPEPFDKLLTLLQSFHLACNTSLRKLNDLKGSTFNKGNAWGLWIWHLTKIIDAAEFSPAVRKDVGSSKSDTQSPFVGFVWELQACLPEECRLHTHSQGALADAVSSARSKGREAEAQKVGGY